LQQNKTQLPTTRVIYTNTIFSLLLLFVKPSKTSRKTAATYNFKEKRMKSNTQKPQNKSVEKVICMQNFKRNK